MRRIFIINYNIYAYLHRPDLKISGGAELQVSILARQLQKRGFEIFFLTGDFGQDTTVKKEGITFIKTDVNFGPFQKINWYYKQFKSIRPSIILERGIVPLSFLAVVLGKILGIPYIYCGASDINFAKKEIDPSFKGSRIKQKIFHATIPFITHFIVQKNNQSELLRKNFGISEKVSLIRNFPPDILIDEQIPYEHNIYDAAWIANLIPYKKPELFIELARLNPDKKFLLVGGTSDEVYGKKISELISGCNNITATGYVPHGEVIHWVRKSKLIVNTTNIASGFEEGFSNVQIMGWLCGKPSLTLISDPDQLIVKNRMGYRSGNFRQLNEDFQIICNDKNLYNEMSRNARLYAKEHHDTDSIIEKYLEIFYTYSGSKVNYQNPGYVHEV